VKLINVPRGYHATLQRVGTLAIAGLMLLTLACAYGFWSMLLRAERLYTHFESHRHAAADIAGFAFFGFAAVIVLGASAALFVEARQLIGTLFF
jgi:hypothetical protein